MNSIASNARPPPEDGMPQRGLLASRRHTFIFLAICLMVSAVSALNADHGSPPSAPASANHMLQVYLWLIGLEWLWVRFVYKGMQAQRRSILEFIGRRRDRQSAAARRAKRGRWDWRLDSFVAQRGHL
jgi:hypothetical protein